MAMLSFCGIDVSKDRLDVMMLPGPQSFAVRNDAAGWAELIARLRDLAIAAVGLEASGGYERGAMRALLAAGLPACQVNPFKLRQFAKARNSGEKRSARCASNCVLYRHHADTTGAAAAARDRTAGRDAGGSPSAQRRESCH
jgi:transposase